MDRAQKKKEPRMPIIKSQLKKFKIRPY